MATIEERERKSGTVYRAKVRVKGAEYQTATFVRRDLAERWARNTEAAIDEGRYLPGSEAMNHTFGELIEKYLADVASEMSATEQKKRKGHLEWWKKKLGGRSTLAQITRGAIVRHRDAMVRPGKDGKKRSGTTANRYMATLRHALGYASKEWQWMRENPASGIRAKKEKRRERFLLKEEAKALLEITEAREDWRLHGMVLLALMTGARQSEIVSLEWSDIDLTAGSEAAVIQKTKNNQKRSIPLHGRALGWIDECKKNHRHIGGYLFHEPKFPEKEWQKAVKEAKLEDFHFHDLRHTAASHLAMNGASLAELQRILGHKTPAMVMRYAHLTEQHQHAVVRRMVDEVYG